MNLQNRIVLDPGVSAGKPVVKGTRLTAEFVLDLLAAGWAQDDILREYAGVVADDVRACAAYGAARLRAERSQKRG